MNVADRAERAPSPVVAIGQAGRWPGLSLAVAVIATLAACSGPTTAPTTQATTTTAPTTQATTTRPPALSSVMVTGIGFVRQGGTSPDALAFSFLEAGNAAFARGPGSFEVTISDHAGSGFAVRFTGTPSTAKSPGSLGATAAIGGNVLVVSILDSDTNNIEPIIVTGIGIAASPAAAIGSIRASMGSFTGSLAGGPVNDTLASPGTVTAGP